MSRISKQPVPVSTLATVRNIRIRRLELSLEKQEAAIRAVEKLADKWEPFAPARAQEIRDTLRPHLGDAS